MCNLERNGRVIPPPISKKLLQWGHQRFTVPNGGKARRDQYVLQLGRFVFIISENFIKIRMGVISPRPMWNLLQWKVTPNSTMNKIALQLAVIMTKNVILWSRAKRKGFLKNQLFLETFHTDVFFWLHSFLTLPRLCFTLAMMYSLLRAPQNCWRSSNKPRARWFSQQRTTSIQTESWKPSILRCEMESASWVLEVRLLSSENLSQLSPPIRRLLGEVARDQVGKHLYWRWCKLKPCA